MSRVTRAHRDVGVTAEPFRLTVPLLEGEVYSVGKGGHLDPGALLEDVVPRNTGEAAFFVSSTLRGALGTTTDAEPIPALSLSPGIDAPHDTIFLCNRDGTGASTVASIVARQTALNNSGKGPPSHPGSGCFPFVVPAVNSGSSTVTRTIRTRQRVTHLGVYSNTVRTITGTYTLAVQVRRAGITWSLMTGTFDLEGLAAATLSSPALVADETRRVLEIGDELEVIATSNASLNAGDLLVAVETEQL